MSTRESCFYLSGEEPLLNGCLFLFVCFALINVFDKSPSQMTGALILHLPVSSHRHTSAPNPVMEVAYRLTTLGHGYVNSRPLMLSTLTRIINCVYQSSKIVKYTKDKNLTISLTSLCIQSIQENEYLIKCIKIDCFRSWISAKCFCLFLSKRSVLQNHLRGNHVYLLQY